MRILHFLHYTSVGGVENYTRDLFAALEARGHENVLVADGHALPALERPTRTVYRAEGLSAQRPAAALLDDVWAIVVGGRCDIAYIHTTLPSSLAVRIMDKLGTVYFAHTYDAFCASGALLYEGTDGICPLRGVPDWRCLMNAYAQKCNTRRPLDLLARYKRTRQTGVWAREADAIVCDSEYVRRRHGENGFALDKIYRLPSPVPIPDRAVLEASSREAMVLYVGRVTPQKGLDYLIRAFARIRRPARLVVAGDGYELPKVRQLAADLGITDRVAFLGELPRDEVNALYLQAAVVVVPSVWPEPFGMVGPEAMVHGAPVVASRVGGIPEWLADGETGYLVAPRDIEDLARRLELLLSDPELGRRLGVQGRLLAEQRYSFDRHTEGLLRLFTSVIERRSGTARAGRTAG